MIHLCSIKALLIKKLRLNKKIEELRRKEIEFRNNTQVQVQFIRKQRNELRKQQNDVNRQMC